MGRNYPHGLCCSLVSLLPTAVRSPNTGPISKLLIQLSHRHKNVVFINFIIWALIVTFPFCLCLSQLLSQVAWSASCSPSSSSSSWSTAWGRRMRAAMTWERGNPPAQPIRRPQPRSFMHKTLPSLHQNDKSRVTVKSTVHDNSKPVQKQQETTTKCFQVD